MNTIWMFDLLEPVFIYTQDIVTPVFVQLITINITVLSSVTYYGRLLRSSITAKQVITAFLYKSCFCTVYFNHLWSCICTRLHGWAAALWSCLFQYCIPCSYVSISWSLVVVVVASCVLWCSVFIRAPCCWMLCVRASMYRIVSV